MERPLTDHEMEVLRRLTAVDKPEAPAVRRTSPTGPGMSPVRRLAVDLRLQARVTAAGLVPIGTRVLVRVSGRVLAYSALA